MGRKKPTPREDDSSAAATVAQGGGAKSRKKAAVIDDDEYSLGTDFSEEQPIQEEKVCPVAGKKKGKKGSSKNSQTKDDDFEEKGVEEEGDDAPAVQFAGKKKSKSKKSVNSSVFSASSFGLLGEEEDEDGDDEDVASEEEGDSMGDKSSKNKKGSGLFSVSAFGAIGDEDEGDGIDDSISEQQDDNDDEPVIAFSGKKKSSKSKKKSGGSAITASSFDGLEDKDEAKEDEEDVSLITFTGKKKSSKKKTNTVLGASEAGIGDKSTDIVEPEQPSISVSSKEADDSKSTAETSKNKKKKKKSGRTAQEEDDLEKILAELGEAPSTSKPAPAPPQEEKVQTQPEPIGLENDTAEKEAEEEGAVESAAAKKKKKKKEKEKEKKAAAAAAVEVKQEKQEETKGKVADKKVPKHVREMQERLAKLKELEERKKREEEEKLKKEEEERRRQEELERLAEEKKRLKKEKEKEKLLKKKQEGKLLTGKQKEEARRLEAMRNQILANAGLPLPSGDNGGAPTKRPKYQTKKSKPHLPQANGVAPVKAVESEEVKDQEIVSKVESLEPEKVEAEELVSAEEKTEVANVVEENIIEEEEDDDEWDAKSWDDTDLKLPGKSAFADEEDESEPELVVKKEIKSARAAIRDAGPPHSASNPAVATQNVISAAPIKSQDVESKRNQPENAVTDNKRKEVTGKREAQNSDALSNQSESNLRSPICCIMGHVDTGKTKLLDCIRGTNVQEGEAGGITQQIGATYFPAENIRERTKELKDDAKLNVPGLLVIDTPGHESFTNLRSRGSGLCDIAILVVDIMHGLEPQTIESLNLLKMRNTEFIVALNKVDRLYGWKASRNAPIRNTMKEQSKDVKNEFNMRVTQVITQFKEQGLNTELYYKNKEMGETFSIVPTSAISGEGIPDLLLLLVQWTQKTMIEKLTYSNEVQCTVLEVKVVEGHGTTIDVVLVNGVLHEGDQIVVCGMQGPIVTSIRALLTPHPMKELRVKGTYLHHKEIKAAQGIKITAQGLEHAIAGTGLHVVGPNDDVEDMKESAMEDMKSVLNRIDKTGEGVCVQASTLGSLEALLEFLKTPAVNIPVSGISIGPVHKKDVMKASVMLEKKKEYATILAFDVKVTQEARELADEVGVKIFMADIIYHLFDQFKAYIDNLKEEKKKEAAEEAVFPCVLKIMPNCVFNKKDPIVLGVDVLEGIAKVGTPICIPQRDFIDIGRIGSIENNHKPVDYAKKGQKVAIKIVGSNAEEQQKMFGRHFEIEDELVSHISRRSIDILKSNYRDDLSIDEWRLVVKLKTLFKIQ
ncbi:eukaryotic translation initiation factor 5B [Cornus florida]|uniref:eukaryotic translation initiation factor 5B n=1 Tax=Cornus florida TaxID=4283 RepID=UPI00289CCDDF|nr:eukaryotic translation initiation factor 5B [Cornus florida]